MEIEQVRIMSLHKSKGLSSPIVFIAGCVEGLHPSRPEEGTTIAEQQRDLEEQRRLFYVGITRVKADLATEKVGTLILTNSTFMPLDVALGSGIQPAQYLGNRARLLASRFLQELGPSAPAREHG
jgi:superfamily I DNA/RNA helicase